MEIYDISMMIERDMTVYKDRHEKRPHLEQTRRIVTDGANESTLHLNTHAGTHMDAPSHMIECGGTIDEIDLSRCLTPCKVLDLTGEKDCITAQSLKAKRIAKGDFVLLKTKNSFDDQFNFHFVYLESSGAEYLRDAGVIGVGIDCLGIERDQPEHDTHRTLLPAGIIILEGLRLKDVEEDSYILSALPLKIRGSDGSPVRAVLFRL
jgi:arylformamidase